MEADPADFDRPGVDAKAFRIREMIRATARLCVFVHPSAGELTRVSFPEASWSGP